MRLATTLTGLTSEEWALAQSILRPAYEINPDATRVCLTVVHGPEERHVELPLGAFVEVITAMGLERMLHRFHQFRTAQAALTPDALPELALVQEFADGRQSYGPYAGETTGEVDK